MWLTAKLLFSSFFFFCLTVVLRAFYFTDARLRKLNYLKKKCL